MKEAYSRFLELYGAEASDCAEVDAKRFDRACEEFMKAERVTEPDAWLLVQKGRAIQLSSEDCPYTLEDAEKAYKRAIEEDETCIAAYLELGYYYLNVQDDAGRAKPYFEKALAAARDAACEATAGVALCLSEMESPEAALEYLEATEKMVVDHDLLKRTRKEIEELG